MPRQVAWKLRLKAESSAEVDERLKPFLNLVTTARTGTPKQCGERPELWEVSMTTEFASPPAQGLLQLLWTADCLGSGWIVFGPNLWEDGEIAVFAGIFRIHRNSRAQVWGLEWASFDVAQLPATGGA